MNVCRTCLEDSTSELVPVFSKLDGEFIANIIVNCSSVSIVEDDGLPGFVCSECLSSIKQIAVFAKKARESDLKLRNIAKPEFVAEQKEDPGWFDVLVTQIKIESENNYEDSKHSEQETDRSDEDDFDNCNDSDWKDSDGNMSRAARVKDNPIKLPTERSQRPVYDDDGNDEDDGVGDDGLDAKEREVLELVTIDADRHICCLCSYDFGSRDELEAHGQENHVKKRRISRANKPFFCVVCYKRYCTEEALQVHLNLAAELINRNIYRCKLCPARFWSTKRRRHHAHNHPKYIFIDDTDGERKKRVLINDDDKKVEAKKDRSSTDVDSDDNSDDELSRKVNRKKT